MATKRKRTTTGAKPYTLPAKVEMSKWALPMAASKARRIVIYGGRGGGKDYAVADMALARMMSNIEYNIVCLRQFQRTMRDSLKSLVAERIRAHGWSEHFDVHHSEIICRPSQSRMLFYGFERNAANIRGLQNISLSIVNEAQMISQESDDDLMPSIRGDGGQTIYIGNPRYPQDYFTTMFQGVDRKVWQDGELYSELFPVNWQDNKWFPRVLDLERRRKLGQPNYHNIWEGHLISAKGAFFDASQITAGPAWHREGVQVRAWDLAATAGGGDYSVGVLMAKRGNAWQIQDVQRGQWDSAEVLRRVQNTAAMDGVNVSIVIEEEGGAAGKRDVYRWRQELAGYRLSTPRATGPKDVRARGFAASVNNGLVSEVAGSPWIADLHAELAAFSSEKSEMKGIHDDQVDACAMAYTELLNYQPLGSATSGRSDGLDFGGNRIVRPSRRTRQQEPEAEPAPADKKPGLRGAVRGRRGGMPGW